MLRLLTENLRKLEIQSVLSDLGLDYTMIEAEGSWKNVKEQSLIIEFEGEHAAKVIQAAQRIRDLNKQQVVYVQEIQTKLHEIKEY